MTKEELRKLYKEKRSMVSPKDLEEKSLRIVEMFLSKYDVDGKTISLFLPIEKHREINTYHLLDKIMSFGGKVALPKANMENGNLRHFIYESPDQLEVSAYGIPEPKKGKAVSADRLDIVLVPLLAFSEKGNRVGYGKGFYDRLLQKCNPLCQFIGLSIFEESEIIDDVFSGDVQLNALIHPNGFMRF